MRLLSVGTIVMLKGGDKTIMIYGLNVVNLDNKEKYDYLACLYPEGYLGDEHNIFLNHSDIVQIISENKGDFKW